MDAPGYVIANYKVTDPELYADYRASSGSTTDGFDVHPLVVSHESRAMDGDAPGETTIVLKFSSVAEAHAWYESDAYQAVLGKRVDSTDGFLVIVPGFVMPS